MTFGRGVSQCRTQVLVNALTVQIKCYFKCPVTAAGSTGRCNTIQCVDPTMLARDNHLFRCTRSKPSQDSVPTRLTLASDFSSCFQCQEGSRLVLHRPIETTTLIRHYANRPPGFGFFGSCQIVRIL